MALNRVGRPLEGVKIHAINHEYLFRQTLVTGPDGFVTVKGIPGKWSFFGTLGWERAIAKRGAGYAPMVLGRAISGSGEIVTLRPDTTATIKIDNQLPGFTGDQPTAVHLVEPQYGPMVGSDIIGVEAGNQLVVDLNQDTTARIGLGVWPQAPSPGLFYLGEPVNLAGTVDVVISSQHLGKVRIEAYDKNNRATRYHLQVQNFQRSWQWAPFIGDLPAGPHDYYLSPGDYFFIRGLDMEANQQRYRVVFNPVAWSIKPGENSQMGLGAPSQYRVFITPKPAPGFGDYTQVLLDVRDSYYNQITEVWGPTGREQPHARITTPSGRIAEVDIVAGFAGKVPGTFDVGESPRFEMSWDFGPFGSGSLSGSEYSPEILSMYAYATERLIPQSPSVHRGRHDAWVSYYDRLAKEMEILLGVPTDYPLGVIQNIMHAGFADETLHGFKVEVPLEFIADPARRDGNFYHAHEEGHGRIHKPPANFWAIRRYYETYATVMGYEATARVTNVPRFVDWLYASHDFFLRHLHGEPIDDTGDEIEVMQFITYYLRGRYGFDIHRRMILEWDNALQPARSLLTQRGYSDLEQFAATYSYLAGGHNLAWLFRVAGLDVLDERVASGLGLINQMTVSQNGIELALGQPEAVHDQVSVALMVRRTPTQGFSDLRIILAFDPKEIVPVQVYKRDLTYPEAWRLTADVPKPGELTIALSANEAARGLGSVAQVNFKLTPGASRTIPIRVVVATSSAGPVKATDGQIVVRSEPSVVTLPPLPHGKVRDQYEATLSAQGGQPPYSWAIVDQSLPPGLNLDGNTGVISGVPSANGNYQFRVEVRDSKGLTHRRLLTLTIQEG